MHKVSTLDEAVRKHVTHGAVVAIEGFGHLVPVAAAHEIIRQKITGLTLVRMSGEAFIDQMLAGGCVDTLMTSFIGNSSAGSLKEVRRRIEKDQPRPLKLIEYSHGGMVARFIAGASKLPFMPTKSYRGTDLREAHPDIRTVADPYTGQKVNVVPALNPDVSIIHAQRADRKGNVQAWGILGMQQEVAFAGKKVIVTVEEIVDEELIRSDPNRTIVPGTIVDAVVECPWGSYPSSVQGYYSRDDDFIRQWAQIANDHDDVVAWVDKFIRGTANNEEFRALFPLEHWSAREVTSVLSTPVDYGSRA